MQLMPSHAPFQLCDASVSCDVLPTRCFLNLNLPQPFRREAFRTDRSEVG